MEDYGGEYGDEWENQDDDGWGEDAEVEKQFEEKLTISKK